MPRWGGYTVNLIHYEDAAGLCLAVLQVGGRGAAAWEGRCCMGDALVWWAWSRPLCAAARNARIQHNPALFLSPLPLPSQGRGNSAGPYRGRTFLGCDSYPITFEVRL